MMIFPEISKFRRVNLHQQAILILFDGAKIRRFSDNSSTIREKVTYNL